MQKELYNELDKFWQGVVDELIQSLKDVDRYASGVTAQSIGEYNTKPVTIEASGFKIILGMPDYYVYMDEGVSGAINNTNRSRFKYTKKMPPVKAIRRFMINRAIVPKNFRTLKNSKTRSGKRRSADDVLNSLAYAIAYNIYKNGIKKTNFYSNVVNDDKIEKMKSVLLNYYSGYIVKIISN